MFRSFKLRRPWAVALVTFFFGPFIGMLYLNRGRWALLYLVAEVVSVAIAAHFFFPFGVHPLSATTFTSIADLPVRIVGIFHGIWIARHRSEDEPLRWYSRWYSLVGVYLATFALAFAIRAFLYQPFDIPSSSMSPTLNSGDYFFVEKFAYNRSPPQRGDVVVFYADRFRVDYVKRIVGLPGERIQVAGGVLRINGAAVRQWRVQDLVGPCGDSQPCRTPRYVEELPGGRSHFILDLTPNSTLDNTAEFVVPEDSYFVLGDNRDNSMDSRTDLGFVPRISIKGRVAYRFVAGGRLTWDAVH